MADKFAVIGLGQFGQAICKKLSAKGAEVIAIDIDEDRVDEIKDYVSYAVQLDSTDIRALKSQNISEMDAVIVSIGHNFEGMLLTTVKLLEIGVKRLVARTQGKTQRKILEKMGVTEILSPEEEVGINVAERLMNPSMLMCMPLPDDYEIVEITAPKSVVGRSIKDLGLLSKYSLNLVTIIESFGNVELHIKGVIEEDEIIKDNYVLVVFGLNKDVERFIDING
ncbi:MAG: Ktr system potassium uptake protein A [Owenweeksia sp. TMED14]|nr:MAG: Ktr system potassium uptake protein A [Owenweeksia sp. TMED14]|tara:strand:+ start:7864 stop:8535 length:672 start_codon:yes stop_codon:yes gene_type:complete